MWYYTENMANIELRRAVWPLEQVCVPMACQNAHEDNNGQPRCSALNDSEVCDAIDQEGICPFARIGGKLGVLFELKGEWKFVEKFDLNY
jgi:hypothetical protein